VSDPREARTLDEAAANGDGTYNGFRLLSWLSEALHPGQGVSEEDIRADYEKIKAAKAAKARGV